LARLKVSNVRCAPEVDVGAPDSRRNQPVGQIRELVGDWPVQLHFEKYFRFQVTQINLRTLAILFRNEGRIAIVTDVGMGCSGRGSALTNDACSRTVKSCGPDASTLASSWRNSFPPMTVTKKPDRRGEHEISR
jgi:hypothetical protein